jgi:hypothetical protein
MMKRFIQRDHIDDVLELVRGDEDLQVNAVDYAARLGRHRVTQALLGAGSSFSRTGLLHAIERKGIGADLLLEAVCDADRQQSLSTALAFRLADGQFERAFAMLDQGVKPDHLAISYAYDGAIKRSHGTVQWEPEFHQALDQLLPRLDAATLRSSPYFHFLVDYGRPIHLERCAEILDCTLDSLLPYVMWNRRDDGFRRLRKLGAKLTPAVLSECTRAIEFIHQIRDHFNTYLMRLSELVKTDLAGPVLSAKEVAPLLRFSLSRNAPWLRNYGEGEANLHFLKQDLVHIVPLVNPEEMGSLHNVVDVWNASAQEPIDASEVAAIRRVIDIIAADIEPAAIAEFAP